MCEYECVRYIRVCVPYGTVRRVPYAIFVLYPVLVTDYLPWIFAFFLVVVDLDLHRGGPCSILPIHSAMRIGCVRVCIIKEQKERIDSDLYCFGETHTESYKWIVQYRHAHVCLHTRS